MTLRPLGLIIVATTLATPFIWWPQLATKYDSVAIFSQYLGILALIAMAIGQVIATRLPFVEWVFGGLDRGYILHKWLGIGAMVAILLHNTIDAEIKRLGRETFLVELAETTGEFSLYGLLLFVGISIATFIPYHLWLWTHKIIGSFFILSSFHFLFILKPFSNSDPLGLYVTAFCLVGILAFVYKLLPRNLRPSKKYEITDLQATGRATAITMKPIKRAIKYRPGQFAFVTFAGVGLSEAHPFTISKAPDNDGYIRITVSSLGDYTSKLHYRLNVGGIARIEGPFGRFERKRTKAPEIWIGAGIGITPFVAWAQGMAKSDKVITLFYSVCSKEDAAHLDELQAIEANHPNFKIILHETKISSRLNAQTIASYMPSDSKKTQVYFCGPKPMRKILAKTLSKYGVPTRRFHYEVFEIRSGIGIWTFTKAIMQRLLKMRATLAKLSMK